MKLTFTFLILVIFLSYCSHQSEPEFSNIHTSFKITDKAGNEKYSFKMNEEFIVNFEIVNSSTKELTFDTSLPVISFSLKKDDEEICRSIDYMDYAAVWINGELKVGKSIQAAWEEAPNTKGRIDSNEIIVLDPGTYIISVHHASFFNEIKFPDTDDLTIEIIN
jgi:hypothetical protein